MTTLEIELLLHYHTNSNIYPNTINPDILDATARFVRDGILEHDLTVTDKGRKLVKMLCETPYPIQRKEWVDPRKEKKDEDLENRNVHIDAGYAGVFKFCK